MIFDSKASDERSSKQASVLSGDLSEPYADSTAGIVDQRWPRAGQKFWREAFQFCRFPMQTFLAIGLHELVRSHFIHLSHFAEFPLQLRSDASMYDTSLDKYTVMLTSLLSLYRTSALSRGHHRLNQGMPGSKDVFQCQQ